MRVVRARRIAALLFVLVVLVAAAFVAAPFAHGLTFVIRAADMQGVARRLAELDAREVRERDLDLPLALGAIRARLYEPVGPRRRTVLLVSGFHPSGIDEPRLVRLARDLAAHRLGVITPDIPELSRFEI